MRNYLKGSESSWHKSAKLRRNFLVAWGLIDLKWVEGWDEINLKNF